MQLQQTYLVLFMIIIKDDGHISIFNFVSIVCDVYAEVGDTIKTTANACDANDLHLRVETAAEIPHACLMRPTRES